MAWLERLFWDLRSLRRVAPWSVSGYHQVRCACGRVVKVNVYLEPQPHKRVSSSNVRLEVVATP